MNNSVSRLVMMASTATTKAAASSIKLKLVGRTSFRPFRNVWMLEELGVPYQHILASPWSKEAKMYNKLGKIPSLVDHENNLVMSESAAINTYLGDKFRSQLQQTTNKQSHHSFLVPTPGTALRGKYEQYVFCIISELDAQGLWVHRKHESLGQFFGTIPQAVSHAKQHFDNVLLTLATDLYENHGPYLLGPDFTAADILFVHSLDWAEAIGWDEAWKENDQNHHESETATASKKEISQNIDKEQQEESGNVSAIMANLREYLARCRGRPAYIRTTEKKRSEEEERKKRDKSKM